MSAVTLLFNNVYILVHVDYKNGISHTKLFFHTRIFLYYYIIHKNVYFSTSFFSLEYQASLLLLIKIYIYRQVFFK